MKKVLKKIDHLIKRIILIFPFKSKTYFYLSRSYYFFRFIHCFKCFPGKKNSFKNFLYDLKVGKYLRHPLRRQITSKLQGKEYIRNRVGAKNLIKTIKVLISNDEIDKFVPKKFPIVIKPDHSSGRYAVVKSLDEYGRLKNQLKEWLLHDYFRVSLEENYYELDKKIIVENYISDEYYLEGSIHCLNGEIKVISLIDRFDKDKKRESFSGDMNSLELSIGFPFIKMSVDKNELVFMSVLKKTALIIAKDLNYIRLDFYASKQKFLLGELTNLPAGGNVRIYPKHRESILDAAMFNVQ